MAARSKENAGGLPDGMIVGIIGLLLGVTVMVWTATGIAAVLAHGGWPQGVHFTRTPRAMRYLATRPHDMAAAWPQVPRGQLSGAGLFWWVFITQIVLLLAFAVWLLGAVARLRGTRPPRARAVRARAARAERAAAKAGYGEDDTREWEPDEELGGAPGGGRKSGPAPGTDDDPAQVPGPRRRGAPWSHAAPGDESLDAWFRTVPRATPPGPAALSTAAPDQPTSAGGHEPRRSPAGTGAHAAGPEGPGVPGAPGGPAQAPGWPADAGPGGQQPPWPGAGTGTYTAGTGGPGVPGGGSAPAPGWPQTDAGPYRAGPDGQDGRQSRADSGMYGAGPGDGGQQWPAGARTGDSGDSGGTARPPAGTALAALADGEVTRTYALFAEPRGDKAKRVVQPAVLAAAGPVVVTTADPETYHQTAGNRAKLGPVHVYDPAHLVDVPGRLRWAPHGGCERPETARIRAAALLAPLRTARADEAIVHEAAVTLLRCWLHAAAVDGRPFRQVQRWAAGGAGAGDAVRVLRTDRDAASGWSGELESVLHAHPERRDAAQALIRHTLEPLNSVHIRDACTPAKSGGLDLESFTAERGTLYVVGERIEDPRSHLGAMPLLTALVSSVVEHGRRMAAGSPAGRLDPPLTFVLDDIAALAPAPDLPELLAEGHAAGLPTLAVLRSPEQGTARWQSPLWQRADMRVALGDATADALPPAVPDAVRLR